MFRMLIAALLTALVLSACIVVPADHGPPGMVVAPALPAVVELGPDPYYYQRAYYYCYDNNR